MKTSATVAISATSTSVQSDGIKSINHTTSAAEQHFGNKIGLNACAVRNFTYLCGALHTKGGHNSLNIAGYFYTRYILGSILPCGALMRPLPFVGVVQRVGIEPFYLHIVKLS